MQGFAVREPKFSNLPMAQYPQKGLGIIGSTVPKGSRYPNVGFGILGSKKPCLVVFGTHSPSIWYSDPLGLFPVGLKRTFMKRCRCKRQKVSRFIPSCKLDHYSLNFLFRDPPLRKSLKSC